MKTKVWIVRAASDTQFNRHSTSSCTECMISIYFVYAARNTVPIDFDGMEYVMHLPVFECPYGVHFYFQFCFCVRVRSRFLVL